MEVGYDIQLTAAHILGKQNIIADRESRICHVDSEWMLSPRYLHQSLNLRSFKSDLDLFAIQINRQFSDYVAYRPDPEAKIYKCIHNRLVWLKVL